MPLTLGLLAVAEDGTHGGRPAPPLRWGGGVDEMSSPVGPRGSGRGAGPRLGSNCGRRSSRRILLYVRIDGGPPTCLIPLLEIADGSQTPDAVVFLLNRY